MTGFRALLWVSLLWVYAAPPAHALPPVTDLFGCPLIASEDEPTEPPTSWRTRTWADLGVTATLPPNWSVRQDGRSIVAESPDGKAWMNIRRGVAGDDAHLDRVRSDVEMIELGPTRLAPACETMVAKRLRERAGWPTVRLSVTRRALGLPRRAFALFAPLANGTMTAVITVKWSRRGAAPMSLVRRLLSGLRAHQ